ncbi:MAG: flagellar biosynthesis anti-sigma factor FlgM [Gammaproteobacteria bacterium]
MVSEIKGLNNLPVKGPGVGNNRQTEQSGNRAITAETRSERSSSPRGNEVSLTDTGIKLRELEAKIASQPVVDTQRVETIKKAISDGTFRVNVNRTAEKMAEFENLLASKAGDK